MRPPLFIAVLLLALTSFGCGAVRGGAAPAGTPHISNLQYFPHSAAYNTGTIPVTGTIDFTASDGDVLTFTITTYDSGGNQLGSPNTSSVAGPSGVKFGVIGIAVAVSTSVRGNYSFRVYVTDGKGLNSNVLTGTFTVS